MNENTDNPYAPRTSISGVRSRLEFLRPQFKELGEYSDKDFASWYSNHHPEDQTLANFVRGDFDEPAQVQTTAEVADKSPTVVDKIYKGFDAAGEGTKNFMVDLLGAKPREDNEWSANNVKRGVASAVGGLVSGAPEIAAQTIAARSPYKLVQLAGPLAAGVSQTIHDSVRNPDDTFGNSMSGLSQVTSAAGAAIGNKLLDRYAPGSGELARAGVNWLGATIGNTPGDFLGSTEGAPKDIGERIAQNYERLKDPENLIARVGTDLSFATHGYLREQGAKDRANRDAVVSQLERTAEAIDILPEPHYATFEEASKTLPTERQEVYAQELERLTSDAADKSKTDFMSAQNEYQARKAELVDRINQEIFDARTPVTPDDAARYASDVVSRLETTSTPATPNPVETPSSSAKGGASRPHEAATAAGPRAEGTPTHAGEFAEGRMKSVQEKPFRVDETPEEPKLSQKVQPNKFLEALDNAELRKVENSAVESAPKVTLEEAPGYLVRKGDVRIVGDFLQSIKNSKPKVALVGLDPQKHGGGWFDPSRPDQIAVNLKDTTHGDRFKILVEELSHQGVHDTYVHEPKKYKLLDDLTHSMSVEERKSILDAVAKAANYETFDSDYHSGALFPQDRTRITAEFSGGLAKIIGYDVVANRKFSAFHEAMQKLPPPVAKFVYDVLGKINDLFSSDKYLRPAWDDKTKKNFDQTFAMLRKEFVKHDRVENLAIRTLSRVDSLGPDSVVKVLRTPAKVYGELTPMRSNVDQINEHLKGVVESFSYRPKDADEVTLNRFEKFFVNPLQLSLIYQEVRPTFDTLSRHIGLSNSAIEDTLATIGGYGDGKRSLARALEETHSLRTALLDNFSLSSKVIDVMMENQKRRAEEGFTNDKLITKDELKTRGIPEKYLDSVYNLTRIGDSVANKVASDLQERNAYLFGQEIYRFNPKMDKAQAVKLGSTFNKVAIDLGALAVRRKSAIAALSKTVKGTPEFAKATSRVEQLRAETETIKRVVDAKLQGIGMDPQTASVAGEVLKTKMELFGADSVQWAQLSMKNGYIPMTRRGKHLLIITDKETGAKSTFDNNDKAKVVAKMRELEKNDKLQVSYYDKDAFEQKYQNMHLDDIERLRNEQNDRAQQLIQDLRNKNFMDPKVQQALTELEAAYKVPDVDYNAALSVKGDLNKMRREMVGGFNKNDLLANSFDYVRSRLARSTREVTKAKVALELMDPFYTQNPKVHEQMKQVKDYVLNANAIDFAKVRAFTNTMAIGGSIKQLVMNGFQQINNGFPMLVERLRSNPNKSYSEADALGIMFKSMKAGQEFSSKGFVEGDLQLSQLLAVAKKQGITTPNTLEMVIPENAIHSDAMGHLGELITKGATGQAVLPQAALRARRGVMYGLHMLRTSAAVGEMLNRNLSFIQGVYAGRKLGVHNQPDGARKLFEFAARFTTDVNFAGDKANRPGWQQQLGLPNQSRTTQFVHGASLVAMGLRSFTLNHIGQLYALGKTGKLGAWDYVNEKRLPGVTPDKRAFAASIYTLLLTAGGSGMVMAQDIDETMKAMFGKGWTEYVNDGTTLVSHNFEDNPDAVKLVHDIGNGLKWGLPAAIAGVDTSSAGPGQLLGLSHNESVAENFGNLSGVTLGQISSSIRGLGALANGEGDNAIRQGGPVILKQLLRGKEIMTTGKPMNSYGVIGSFVDLKPMEKVGETLGFQSVARKESTEFTDRVKREDAWKKDAVKTAVRKASMQLESGDENSAKQTLDAMISDLEGRGFKIDEKTIAKAIAEEGQDKQTRYLPDDSSNNMVNRERLSESLRQRGASYRPQLETALQSFESALELGLPQAVQQLAQSVQSGSLNQKAAEDILVQTAKLSPAKAKLLLSKSIQSKTRLLQSDTQDDQSE